MNASKYDTLTIVNGPEDGTEFPLTDHDFHLGSDVLCAVQIRLDDTVASTHGHAAVIGGGYRVRRGHGEGIFVNGRPAGRIRSRIARHGDVIRMGHTKIVLTCAPEGLAQRSQGLGIENDILWAGRQAAHATGTFALSALSRGMALLGGLLKPRPVVLLVIAALVLWRMPNLRYALETKLFWLLQTVVTSFSS